MTALGDAMDEIVAFSLGRRRIALPLGPPGHEVGLGVIGAGRWGELLAQRFAAVPEVCVAALTARHAARRTELAVAFPLATLHEDPAALLGAPGVDAVVIATPPASHHELARRALECGKHVLVEKPFALTVADADELIAAAATAGRVLMVDHTWLFEEGARRLKALVAGGEHGGLVRYRGRLARTLAHGAGGALAALGIHHIALLDYLTAELPVRVAAEASVGPDGMDQSCRAQLWYASALHAEIIVDGGLDAQRSTEVVIELGDGTRAVWAHGDAQRLSVDGPRCSFDSMLYREADALTEVARHFIACVAAGRRPVSDGLTGRRTIAVLEACERAWRAGQPGGLSA
jgi:predicted dehydrogenase